MSSTPTIVKIPHMCFRWSLADGLKHEQRTWCLAVLRFYGLTRAFDLSSGQRPGLRKAMRGLLVNSLLNMWMLGPSSRITVRSSSRTLCMWRWVLSSTSNHRASCDSLSSTRTAPQTIWFQSPSVRFELTVFCQTFLFSRISGAYPSNHLMAKYSRTAAVLLEALEATLETQIISRCYTLKPGS